VQRSAADGVERTVDEIGLGDHRPEPSLLLLCLYDETFADTASDHRQDEHRMILRPASKLGMLNDRTDMYHWKVLGASLLRLPFTKEIVGSFYISRRQNTHSKTLISCSVAILLSHARARYHI
jgi:hypothetical protein